MQSPRHFSVEEDLLPRGRPPLVWTQATRQRPCRRGTRELGQGEGRTTKAMLVVVVGISGGWVGIMWCTETYYNFWMRNYEMSDGFLGLFAVFRMLGRLNARWTDVLIVLCESEGDTHASKKEGSTWIILNHRWYIEYAALLYIDIFSRGVGDTCYVRLLYSSSIEFWWQHFPTNMQGFCPPRWSQGVGSRAHQGFSSRPQPVQEEQAMAEETQVTNVPNAALASDSLEEVWTCSIGPWCWTWKLLYLECQWPS